MTHRLGVNLNDDTAAALKEIAARRGITITEAVRRATSVYQFLNDQVHVKGMGLQILDTERNEVTEVELIG